MFHSPCFPLGLAAASLALLSPAFAQDCVETYDLGRDQSFLGTGAYPKPAAPVKLDVGQFVLDAQGNVYSFSTPSGGQVRVSDGTIAGTLVLGQAQAPTTHSWSNWIARVGDKVLFAGVGDSVGLEVWGTDGTVAGTTLLTDGLDVYDEGLSQVAIIDERALFFHHIKGVGKRFLVSDGTPAGTIELTGPQGEPIFDSGAFAYLGSNTRQTLAFLNCTTSSGSGLHRTDGTAAGTFRIVPDTTATLWGRHFPNLGTQTLFEMRSGATTQLWITDGTAAGSHKVFELPYPNGGFDLSHAVEWKGAVYFQASDGVSGAELWKSDGVQTSQVFDLVPGAGSSDPEWMAVVGDALVFVAQDPTHGRELFRLDSTGSVSLVKDIWRGSADSFSNSFDGFAVDGGVAAFAVNDGVHGSEVWTTDGTPAGTHLHLDVWPGATSGEVRYVTARGNGSFVAAATGQYQGREVLYFDVAGNAWWLDLNPGVVSHDGQVGNFGQAFGKSLFLSGFQSAFGVEPYVKTAGQAPQRLGDLIAGASSSSPRDFTTLWTGFSAAVVFTALNGKGQRVLWSSDGTVAGTAQLDAASGGPVFADLSDACLLDGKLYFLADDPLIGRELWVTDGTVVGTHLVIDLIQYTPQVPGDVHPRNLVTFQGAVWFQAITPNDQWGLYRSDGTAAGTHLSATFGPRFDGTLFGIPIPTLTAYNPLVASGGRLFFVGHDPAFGPELWSSDGTPQGTSMVVDLYPGVSSSLCAQLTPFAGGVVFSASVPGQQAKEPFVSDGTAAGTHMLADVGLGATGSNPEDYFVIGTQLFFLADPIPTGRELWTSDGTATGTQLVEDLSPGPADSVIGGITPVDAGFYFKVTPSGGEPELRFCDLSSLSTQKLCTDVGGEPIQIESSQLPMIIVDGTLYFAGLGPEGHVLAGLPVERAYVENLTVGTEPLQLQASAPILGSGLTLSASAVQPGSLSVLLASSPVVTPMVTQMGVVLQPGSVSFLDSAQVRWLGSFASTGWTWSVQLPSSASLVGLDLIVQVFEQGLGGALPRSSNGQWLHLGL